MFGRFNMLKTEPVERRAGAPAVNFAINRADLVQYATNGNGVVIPALVPGLQIRLSRRIRSIPVGRGNCSGSPDTPRHWPSP